MSGDPSSRPPAVSPRPFRPQRLAPDELLAAGKRFVATMQRRRSIRQFSDAKVPRAAIELAITAANAAPSGANLQPWTFVAVDDPQLKRQIREAAEAEEQLFYSGRAPDSWLADLAPIGTDWHKPFLEEAPFLIVVFRQAFGHCDGEVRKHYYTMESVGIAVGFLIACLQQMGLVTLTHTPSPMTFLAQILGRPTNERAFLLLPVGHPHPEATVPALTKKPLEDVLVWNRDSGGSFDATASFTEP